jgi:hypothetical protein
MKDTSLPAFPVLDRADYFTGMTIRDYHASHAPPVADDFKWENGDTTCKRQVRWNYFYADEMLRQRCL